MSQQLINRSADLLRLRNGGFDIEIRANHLLVKGVPYVNAKAEVKTGTIVSTLSLAGDVTTTPDTHVAYFIGEHPCNRDGSEIRQIKHGSQTQSLGRDLEVNHSFSNKPPGGYPDYYEKMTTYVRIISSPAQSIAPTVTAQTYPVYEATEEESVFRYIDTAATRAGINAVTSKLELNKVGIVGLGGTGAYVLDLVVKTPVKEIHLYDGDVFSQHNAFRAPGAPSVEDLRTKPKKVAYLAGVYSKMHRSIIPHDSYIESETVHQLRELAFVFLCLEGSHKKLIVEQLEVWEKPFVEVGMGIQLVESSLLGILRVTTSTPKKRDHIKCRIPFSDAGDNEYSRNIQVADLNALNAALAVIKWKKLFGFYTDLEKEHNTTFTTSGNQLLNEDQA